MKQNKLRTLLTGFSIAWGIFMLIFLLAAGNGLKNGVTSNFKDSAVNTVTLYANRTSIPFNGYDINRPIKMDNKDLYLLDKGIPEVDVLLPSFSIYSGNITYKSNTTTCGMNAVYPDYLSTTAGLKITQGRFINELDIKECRKSVILCHRDVFSLFGRENPIGKKVNINNLIFTVVGIYKSDNTWESDAYIPYSTGISIYNPEENISAISFTVNGLNDKEANMAFNKRLRNRLSISHQFHPDDENAIFIWNELQGYLETLSIFSALNILIWIIGIGTLIAGIVGVSNIMLITVKERTKEFGIRKALGAPPHSILQLVIGEALFITSIFGYIGMIIGIFVTELINYYMINNANSSKSSSTEEMMPNIFLNPTVDLKIVFSALLVMIIAGVLAGFFPARKAVKIKPIESLRYE